MIWLLNDFDLLSMLLHAATLSLEALLVGGVLFLLAVAVPGGADEGALCACWRGMQWAALAMIVAEIASIVVETSVLVGNSGMTVAQALVGGPLLAQACSVFCALVLLLLARFSQEKYAAGCERRCWYAPRGCWDRLFRSAMLYRAWIIARC